MFFMEIMKMYKMLKVFHNDRFPQFFYGPGFLMNLSIRPVAMVQTSDLHEAYYLTTHNKKRWTENDKVTPIDIQPGSAVRSTYFGDIIVDGNPGEITSTHHIIEPKGFRKLSDREISQLIISP